MVFYPGEEVSILNESGVLTILSVGEHWSYLRDENGFERRVANAMLVKRRAHDGTPPDSKDTAPYKDAFRAAKQKPKKQIEIPSIDLHAEVLNISHKHAHEILAEQLDYFKAFMNKCIDERKSKALIIHGVGDGVLMSNVRSMLKRKQGFTFHDGSLSPRGIGSTLVEIKLQQAARF
ncbi:MAG: hypothetical protein EB023_12690 [Flavobacteriia bacterium]|nr:hypothetical protein [Flavobacteriia bacterium]